YGKVMSLPDHVMPIYFKLVTRYSPAQIAAIEQGLADGSLHPRDVKMELAREIVSIFHGDEAAAEAEERFRTVFQRRELPPEMPEYHLSAPQNIVDLLAEAGLAASKSEARRLVQQGGVRLNGERIEEIGFTVPLREGTLQVGRRRFLRLVPHG
ncbi:MAG TPA: tyrosine--tRNA ligase, partial [Anaerolineae bacterium]|nr:tyrosine--tRNA ligase [Anaerolineae bacterium]